MCSFKHLYKYLPDHAAIVENKVIDLVFVYSMYVYTSSLKYKAPTDENSVTHSLIPQFLPNLIICLHTHYELQASFWWKPLPDPLAAFDELIQLGIFSTLGPPLLSYWSMNASATNIVTNSHVRIVHY